MRDHPRLRPEDKATLTEILEHYNTAGEHLADYHAAAAVPPEKQAYVTLRKFVQELWKNLMAGGGALPEKPDRLKMEDQVHLNRYEKERIEWELKKLTDKLISIDARQKELQKAFEHFLKQSEKQKNDQKTAGQESWLEKSDDDPNTCQPKPGMTAQSPPPASAVSVEGALPPSKSGQGNAAASAGKKDKPQGKQQAQGKGQGPGTPGQGQNKQGQNQGQGSSQQAHMQERLAMLTARQKALAGEVQQLSRTLEQLPSMNDPTDQHTAERQDAQKHLDDAVENMKAFDDLVRQSFYRWQDEQQLLARADEQLRPGGKRSGTGHPGPGRSARRFRA